MVPVTVDFCASAETEHITSNTKPNNRFFIFVDFISKSIPRDKEISIIMTNKDYIGLIKTKNKKKFFTFAVWKKRYSC